MHIFSICADMHEFNFKKSAKAKNVQASEMQNSIELKYRSITSSEHFVSERRQ